MHKLNYYCLILFIFGFIVYPSPAHAYAGPGAAIGLVIVFITVILAFIASFLIGSISFLKNLIHKFKNRFIFKRSNKDKFRPKKKNIN